MLYERQKAHIWYFRLLQKPAWFECTYAVSNELGALFLLTPGLEKSKQWTVEGQHCHCPCLIAIQEVGGGGGGLQGREVGGASSRVAVL